MVKSTIDDIKDITLERQIRKLAGVIDKQNEVISSVGDVDARITAVEDSTANNTVQINSVKEDVSKNTIAIANISNRVTNVEQSTEAIPGIQTEIDSINKSLVNGVTASFDNPSRTLMISVEREASPSIDATVVIPASSETGQYSAGNGITIENYQIAVDTQVVALKTDIPVVPDVTELTQRVQTLETEMPTKASVDDVNALETTVTELTGTVAGKVAIAQGTENAGKVLGIGSDGNVTPVNAGGSVGDVWEEVDLNHWPTDWKNDERIRFILYFEVSNDTLVPYKNNCSEVFEFSLGSVNSIDKIIGKYGNYHITLRVNNYNNFNATGEYFFLSLITISTNATQNSVVIGSSNISDYAKVWRLKQSS